MDSKLQIISGALRARKLRVPHSARPTQNMARAAVFNMLGEILLEPFSKLNAWDAFAGSGGTGGRGAVTIYGVDGYIYRHIARCGACDNRKCA